MAFISGNNLGGKDVEYYDNPNFDPERKGKSKTDYIKKQANESAEWAETANYNYYEVGVGNYDDIIEAEGEAAYNKSIADKQVQETVSYFRAKERERLNPGGAGNKIINEKFSKPSGTLDDKLGKFGFSYDPEDPDNYYYREPNAALSDNVFDTSRTIPRNTSIPGVDPGSYQMFESTVQYEKGNPLAKTVAGFNQELQAVKARTRDAAMEFRGRVYDFIEEVTKNINDDFVYNSIEWDRVRGGPPAPPPSYSSIEKKYFPNSGDVAKARNTILKMIDSTDNEPPLNTLRGVTEEMAAVKDPGLRDMGIGADRFNKWGASNENTLKNLESGIKEFQAWKAKKGVPRIIRLINKLP